MSFSALWQQVKHSMKPGTKQGTRGSRRRHSLRNRRKAGSKLWLEVLEERTLPSTVNWIGGSGDWDTPANWLDTSTNTNHVPGATDDAVINTSGISVTHASGADSVNSVASTDAIVISGGSLSVAADSALTNAAVPDVLILSGGTLTESGNLAVNGHFTWSSGTLSGGGTLTAQGGMLLQSSGLKVLDGITLDNLGAAVWSAGQFNLNNGATLINEAAGTLDVQANDVMENTAGAEPSFMNQGLLERSAGSGTARLLVPIISTGPVAVHVGGLGLGSDTTSHYSGPIAADPGTSLTFDNGIQTIDGPVSGDQITFGNPTYGGTFAVNGSYSATSTQITGGHVTFANASDPTVGGLLLANATVVFDGKVNGFTSLTGGGTVDFLGPVQTFTLSFLNLNGTLSGPDSFLVTGATTWNGGTIQGSGTLTAQGGLFLGLNPKVLDGMTLDNAGAAVWSAGQFNLNNGATLINEAAGTLDVQANDVMENAAGAEPSFINQGLLERSAGSGTARLLVPIISTGPVAVHVGGLGLGSDTTSHYSGPIAADPGTTLTFDNGVQTLDGPVSGDHITFGNPTYGGSFTFTALSTITANTFVLGAGSRDMQIGGPNPGMGYDQITVGNSATLAGPLQLDLVNGFKPFLNEQFTILHNLSTNSLSGTFSNLPEGSSLITGGSQFQITYQGGTNHNDVVLTVIKVTPSITWSNPGAITYGTPLGTAQLDATATALVNASSVSVPGSFAYSPAAGTILNAGGSQTLGVTLTPTDTTHFFPATATVTINVLKAALSVTVANVSRIYGVPNPPLTGTITGVQNSDNITATYSTSATQSSPPGTYPIIATLNDPGNRLGNYTVTVTNGTLTVSASVYVLNSQSTGALTISGNATINLPGTLVVDSTSSSAILASGNAKITAAGGVLVAGGVSKSGNASVTKTGTPGATGDPLASLAAPTPPSFTGTPIAETLSGNSTATISQGLYSQITVSGNAKLTLNPGVYVIGTGGVSISGNATLTGSGVTYIIEGGGFTVSGNAGISGSNVLIVNCGSNYPNPAISGETFGGVTLSGNGSFNLNAAITGTYAGILIYQARDNTRALSVSGNSMAGITGTIYAANALLTMSGDASLQNPLVVGTLNLSGNVALTQLAQGSDGAGDSAGIANTLLAGSLDIYIDDPTGYFSADMLARIQDAITSMDALLLPFNVTITEVSDPSVANVILDNGTTSASGDMAGGVLGCFNPTGSQIEITMIRGWNWYAGADPIQIGSGQYDFQTTVTHELGHSLGLGGSSSPTSPMNELLPMGTARRTMTVADLNIPEPPDGADPLTAAPRPSTGMAEPFTVRLPASPAGFTMTLAPTGNSALVYAAPLLVAPGRVAFVPPSLAAPVVAPASYTDDMEPWLDAIWASFEDQPARTVPGLEPASPEGLPLIFESSIDIFRLEAESHEAEVSSQQVPAQPSAVLDQVFAQMAEDMDDFGDVSD
jgi:hypothetical protein